VGAHCQGDKLHTVCIGERKHSPVIGRAKESPFLAVGGETFDQHEWRTGVKRWSIAGGGKHGTKGIVHVVMYDFHHGMPRVRVIGFTPTQPIKYITLIYVYSLLTTLEWPGWILLGQLAFNKLSLNLYLEAVMGLPRLLSIPQIPPRSSSSNFALCLQTYTMRWQKFRVAPIRETLYQALSARG
jgi:hypothetical protein